MAIQVGDRVGTLRRARFHRSAFALQNATFSGLSSAKHPERVVSRRYYPHVGKLYNDQGFKHLFSRANDRNSRADLVFVPQDAQQALFSGPSLRSLASGVGITGVVYPGQGTLRTSVPRR